MLRPDHFDILNAFLGGRTVAEISQDRGIPLRTVYSILNSPNVKPELLRRLGTLAERVLTFKLDAFDGAEKALNKLVALSQDTPVPAGTPSGGVTKELQRLASLDVIKIAAMMPRRRILVESDTFHGIDGDTRDWITTVIREVQNMSNSGNGSGGSVMDELFP